VRALRIRAVVALALCLSAPAWPQAARRARPPAGARPPAAVPAPVLPADEGAFFADAAAVAWRFVQANLQPTGLVSALPSYPYTTTWDIGSDLAALYCAHELRLVDDARYQTQVHRLLRTLAHVDLFDGAAFNKVYATRTASMVARNNAPSKRGYGWSATDIGRLLVWLKIVSTGHPEYADEVTAVVGRLAPDRLARDGYVVGGALEGDGRIHDYPEGRLGYEQYAARGFALWGFPVEKALDLDLNAVPITVMGKTLAADVRGTDRLTAEPFALTGLELGFTPPLRGLAEQLLGAMEERFRRSGRITMLAEDAISQPPHYFFYYCAYANGKEFALDVQAPLAVVDGPRWASTKGAFAWRVLFPTDYTRKVLEAVIPSRTPAGWGSGVYEADGRSTGTANINTQAVILEAALVRQRGRPLLEARD